MAIDQTSSGVCRFGLFVTGKGERNFLPRFFRSLQSRSLSVFEVVRKIGQRSPLGERKVLRMVGTGKKIPDLDETEIGLPARRYILSGERRFVVVIDDVEFDRRPQIELVFQRYQQPLEVMLQATGRQADASVHFLANMLEAYYFADSNAVNNALNRDLLDADYAEDVEAIRHPKNELKKLASAAGLAFDEIKHGAAIVDRLDLDHVLDRTTECAFLRSLFGWCVRKIVANGLVWDAELADRYQLQAGVQSELTRDQ